MKLFAALLVAAMEASHARTFLNPIPRGGSTSTTPPAKTLNLSSISPNLLKMEYAVRGTVVIAADAISEELSSTSPHPFDKIVYTNIGNPQSVGQQPLTWPRQVLALCDLPNVVGIDHPRAAEFFPLDAIARAREIKEGLGVSGTGAYSHSKGARVFRDDICAFLKERDGLEADPEDIYMTNGASPAIELALTAIVSDSSCGVMIPIPQYPIYSATIDLLGGEKVGYYLDEKKGWDANLKEMERALSEARKRGVKVNSFVLINPGNPTGQVLSKQSIRDICKFCSKHNLILLADEVYQENVYDPSAKFTSCKLAAYEENLVSTDKLELISFHSTSKGIYGECGRRGGYMELVGIDPKVKDQLYKLASSKLCSNLPGQIMTSLMLRGPKPGDESYESHEREKDQIFQSLVRRSDKVSKALDAIDGFSCQKAQGSMYCFPSVEMPEKAKKEAEDLGITVDTLYALDLLEKTGVCVVPASGFGQEDGRFGFRTTFLPSEEEMDQVVVAIKDQYEAFVKKYR